MKILAFLDRHKFSFFIVLLGMYLNTVSLYVCACTVGLLWDLIIIINFHFEGGRSYVTEGTAYGPQK